MYQARVEATRDCLEAMGGHVAVAVHRAYVCTGASILIITILALLPHYCTALQPHGGMSGERDVQYYRYSTITTTTTTTTTTISCNFSSLLHKGNAALLR